MKKILIAATLIGAAIASAILYLQSQNSTVNKIENAAEILKLFIAYSFFYQIYVPTAPGLSRKVANCPLNWILCEFME